MQDFFGKYVVIYNTLFRNYSTFVVYLYTYIVKLNQTGMNQLKSFMESLPRGNYKRIKDQIIKDCFISEAVWKNWLSGRTRVPELAKPIINSVAERIVYETQMDS